MKVFCFTCGNMKAQVVITKGECNLMECTQCGCRWRRSLDPLYERTALVEVDIGKQASAASMGGDKAPMEDDHSLFGKGKNLNRMLFEQRNEIY